jgi:hypothetical protein
MNFIKFEFAQHEKATSKCFVSRLLREINAKVDWILLCPSSFWS